MTTTTNYKNLAASIDWLYGKGHAARIASFENGEIVVYEKPSNLQFWYKLCIAFDESESDWFDFDWNCYDYDAHKFVVKYARVYRDGHATIAA